jgi:hypothetical protein
MITEPTANAMPEYLFVYKQFVMIFRQGLQGDLSERQQGREVNPQRVMPAWRGAPVGNMCARRGADSPLPPAAGC